MSTPRTVIGEGIGRGAEGPAEDKRRRTWKKILIYSIMPWYHPYSGDQGDRTKQSDRVKCKDDFKSKYYGTNGYDEQKRALYCEGDLWINSKKSKKHGLSIMSSDYRNYISGEKYKEFNKRKQYDELADYLGDHEKKTIPKAREVTEEEQAEIERKANPFNFGGRRTRRRRNRRRSRRR